jgi:hypothetical protein
MIAPREPLNILMKCNVFLKSLFFLRPARFARSKHCITATFTNWIPIGYNRANAPSNTLCIHFLTCFRRCTPEYHANYNKIHVIFHRSDVTLSVATGANISQRKLSRKYTNTCWNIFRTLASHTFWQNFTRPVSRGSTQESHNNIRYSVKIRNKIQKPSASSLCNVSRVMETQK